MEQSKRTCSKCGCILASHNRNSICAPCQKAAKENSHNTSESCDQRYYDLEQIRELLGLDSYEQARRKAHRGEIPGRVPGIRRYLFDKQTVDNWQRESFNDEIPRKLSEETSDALSKMGEIVSTLERRMPLKSVVESFEKQYPLQEVSKNLLRFVQEAPPPNEVLNDIFNTLFKR